MPQKLFDAQRPGLRSVKRKQEDIYAYCSAVFNYFAIFLLPHPIRSEALAIKFISIYVSMVAFTCFAFSLALNFTKSFLAHHDGLVPDLASLVLQQLLTYQFLYFQQKFCFHSNFIETKIHPIFTIRLHFTQKVVGKIPFLYCIKIVCTSKNMF